MKLKTVGVIFFPKNKIHALLSRVFSYEEGGVSECGQSPWSFWVVFTGRAVDCWLCVHPASEWQLSRRRLGWGLFWGVPLQFDVPSSV